MNNNIPNKKYKYLFGPVPSRRLGLSLGVDIVPYKTCSQDCLYCECGKTTHLTLERKEYVKKDDITSELNDFLSTAPELDYVTFSGAGEPMLNLRLFEIAAYLKKHFPQYRTALLTNATLLHFTDVIEEFSSEEYRNCIDLIVPSLDAASEETFVKINQPHSDLHFSDIIEGLKVLSNFFTGKIYLEIFIIPGLNDSDKELRNFVNILKSLKVSKIQLNSLDRPAAYSGIPEANEQTLKKFMDMFTENLDVPVEKTGHFAGTISGQKKSQALTEQLIKNMIMRRPCTEYDIIRRLGVNEQELRRYLDKLEKQGILEKEKLSRGIFLRIKKNP